MQNLLLKKKKKKGLFSKHSVLLQINTSIVVDHNTVKKENLRGEYLSQKGFRKYNVNY